MLSIRDKGRNSTHNGLKSIIGSIGTDEFIRVRIGVEPERTWGDRKDYLLAEMSRGSERPRSESSRSSGSSRNSFGRRRGKGDVEV